MIFELIEFPDLTVTANRTLTYKTTRNLIENVYIIQCSKRFFNTINKEQNKNK